MKENKKLPLNFDYIEIKKRKFSKKQLRNSRYYVKSKELQTDLFLRQKPQKNLVRLL